MAYTVSDIDKIVNFKTWSNRKKIDELLRIDSMIYPNLGTESSDSDRLKAKTTSKKIYRSIKKIDYFIYITNCICHIKQLMVIKL